MRLNFAFCRFTAVPKVSENLPVCKCSSISPRSLRGNPEIKTNMLVATKQVSLRPPRVSAQCNFRKLFIFGKISRSTANAKDFDRMYRMNRIQKKRTLRFLSCKSCSSCQKALFGCGSAREFIFNPLQFGFQDPDSLAQRRGARRERQTEI